jgi:hypothetical protein
MGTGHLENDTAGDWAVELSASKDLSSIRRAIAQVIETGDEFLDADVACEGLAACEVIGRLKGRHGSPNVRSALQNYLSGISEPFVDDWVASHPLTVPDELVQLGLAAIDRIVRSPSELPELWKESNHFVEWQQAVADLRIRMANS